MEEKIKVYLLQNRYGDSCIYDDAEKVLHEFVCLIEEAEIGQMWAIEVSEMTQEEFDNLPEFDGF